MYGVIALKDKNGGLLTVCACLGCLLILFCAGASFLLSAQSGSNTFIIKTQSSSVDSNTIGQPQTAESKAGENSSVSQSSSAVAVGSTGEAIGKIGEQFFSPYSARLKYNNVFINNKTSKTVNIKKLLQNKLNFKTEKNGEPQVLIVHTHTTESYMLNSRNYYTKSDATHTKDETKNMVALGNVFKEKLTDAGIGVLHCKTVHDYPSYSGSYDASSKTVTKLLKQNPSIKVIIDIHRDSISDGGTGKIKPTVSIGEKKAAQVMLVMGTNHNAYESNLTLAAKYHQTMEVLYPGLARPMTLYNKKYNQELHIGSMLLEVGTDANTLSEALYGAELAANALVSLLNTIV